MQLGVKVFTDLIKFYESDKLNSLKKKDSPLCIKLIPNIERIKIEKATIAKENKLKRLEMSASNNSMMSSISFDHEAGELHELES